jgi:hypothetical protein
VKVAGLIHHSDAGSEYLSIRSAPSWRPRASRRRSGRSGTHQYRAKRPLMPVRQLATTFPACGILIAMCESSAAFGLMELVLKALQGKGSPAHTAVLVLPEFGAAVLTAVLFGALFRTRFTPLLAIGGLGMLTAAAALLTGLAAGGGTLVAVSSGLIGFGVGASVSPALFITGFSLRSAQIQRVFPWSNCCAA